MCRIRSGPRRSCSNFRFLGRVACLYIARSLGAEALPSLLDVDLAAAPATIVAGGGPLDPVRADVKALHR